MAPMQGKNKGNQKPSVEAAAWQREVLVLLIYHLPWAHPRLPGDSCRKILLNLDRARQGQTTWSLQHSDTQQPASQKQDELPLQQALHRPC